MPAVFRIVSRDSGEAVALSQDLPVSADTTVDVVHIKPGSWSSRWWVTADGTVWVRRCRRRSSTARCWLWSPGPLPKSGSAADLRDSGSPAR